MWFPPHVGAVKFDIGPDGTAWAGSMVVALFGDEAPMTAPSGSPKVGRSLGRVDMTTWTMRQIALPELSRPIDVRFEPHSADLYVLDFGRFEMETERGVVAEADSGALWRIRHSE
jgi:hypothetical protein